MKKLMIAAAIVCAAACAQAAASYEWTFANAAKIYSSSGTDEWGGQGTITCTDLGFEEDVNFSQGYMGEAEFYIDCELDTDYTFTLSMTDGSYKYTQNAVGRVEDFFGNGSFIFGDVLFDGGNAWTLAPEPTSGLLMLLGMAGLALKRKRA